MRAGTAMDALTRCPKFSAVGTRRALQLMRDQGYLPSASPAFWAADQPVLSWAEYTSVMETAERERATLKARSACPDQSLSADNVQMTFFPLPPWLLDLVHHKPTTQSRAGSVQMQDVSSAFPDLFEYQKEGVVDFFRRGSRMCLADTMGLGKTAQACCAIILSAAPRVLVVCPSSLRENWEAEMTLWETKYLASAAADVDDSSAPSLPFQKGLHTPGVSDGSSEPCLVTQSSAQPQEPGCVRKRKCKPKPAPPSSFRVMRTAKDEISHRMILSYSLVAAVLPQLQTSFDFVVLDECHYIKSRDSVRTKAVLKLLRTKLSGPKALFCLSGTPLSRPCDLFTLFSVLLPFQHLETSLRSFKFWPFRANFNHRKPGMALEESFAARFCLPSAVFLGKGRRHEFKFLGTDRMSELQLLFDLTVLRRTKEEVLFTLPPKVRTVVKLDGVNQKETRFFQAEISGLSAIAEKEGKRRADVKLMQLVRETARIKMEKSLPAWLREVLVPQLAAEPEEKLLLFAHHHDVLDFLMEALQSFGVSFINIDGRTKADDRQLRVNLFRDDASVRVAVLGIRSAGTGLNFQRASYVIFVELTWNEKDILQAEDRAHRVGTKSTVFVQYLCLSHSTDEIMVRTIQSKTRNVTKIMKDPAASCVPLLTEQRVPRPSLKRKNIEEESKVEYPASQQFSE